MFRHRLWSRVVGFHKVSFNAKCNRCVVCRYRDWNYVTSNNRNCVMRAKIKVCIQTLALSWVMSQAVCIYRWMVNDTCIHSTGAWWKGKKGGLSDQLDFYSFGLCTHHSYIIKDTCIHTMEEGKVGTYLLRLDFHFSGLSTIHYIRVTSFRKRVYR